MIIVLEGADLTGKTTLAQSLSNCMGIPYTGIWVDLSNPKPAVISVSKTIIKMINVMHPNIIFDRSIMSEWVYSRIKSRENDYIEELIAEWVEIEELFLIFLYADEKILRKRYNKRGDNYLSVDEILRANELYKKLYLKLNPSIKCVLLDVSNIDIDNTVDFVVKWLSEKNAEGGWII